MNAQHHHVFLIYHLDDKPIVDDLAHRLVEKDINPWVDSWNLIPGEPWQEAIETALGDCDTCAILIGAAGIGPWQNEQMRTALEQQIKERSISYNVIPVLLPNASADQLEQLPPFLRRRSHVQFHKSLDDAEALHQLISGIKKVASGPTERQTKYNGVVPYLGLRSFDVADAPLFFGREALVEDLLKLVKQKMMPQATNRFIGIVGSSGSGKSSVARAGLIAALMKGRIANSETWPIAICKPGADPIESLSVSFSTLSGNVSDVAVLRKNIEDMKQHDDSLQLASKIILQNHRTEDRLLVLIDQFEEVFTLCKSDTARNRFIGNLIRACTIEDGKVMLVVVLRADYYGKCAEFSEFARILSQNHRLISQMSKDELQSAIEKPALRTAAIFESGLVNVLLGEVKDQVGMLPLLQHALFELWNKRTGIVLTHHAYQEIGGVGGALDQRAEKIYTEFDEVEKRVCRQLFLRLIELNEENEGTKRRVNLSEFISPIVPRATYEKVLNKLVGEEARLLTIYQQVGSDQSVSDINKSSMVTVEITHEALIGSWKRYREWINTNRSALQILRRLRDSALDWEQNKRNPDLLYHGIRLVEAKELLTSTFDLNPSELEREFITASEVEQERVTKARREQQIKEQLLITEQRNKAKLQRYLIMIGIFFSASTILAALLAVASIMLVQANQENQGLAFASEAQAEMFAQPERAMALVITSASLISNHSNPDFARSLFRVFDNTRIDDILFETQADIETFVWSPVGDQILIGNSSGEVRIWDLTTDEIAHEFTADEQGVLSVAWSPNGEEIATSGRDQTVRIWDVNTGRLRATLSGHTYPVGVVVWSQDGQHIFTGSNDWTGIIWNSETATQLVTLTGHADGITSAAWSPDGEKIITGSGDRTARIWNTTSGEVERVLSGYTDTVTSVAWSPAGDQIVVGSLDNTIRIADAVRQVPPLTIVGHQYGVSSVAWSPDSAHILTGGFDNTVRIWNPRTGLTELTLTGFTNVVTNVAWNRSGSQIAGASQDGTLRVWNTNSIAVYGTVGEHQQSVTSVAWSPNSNLLLTGSLDRTAILWNITDQTITNRFQGHTSGITSVAWSPNGQEIITGSRDSTARIWSVDSGVLLETLSGHVGAITSVAWSPDGDYVATGAEDSSVRIWNVASQQNTLTLQGHTAEITSLDWNSNGQQIITSSLDNTVRIWDISSGLETYRLLGNTEEVTSVAWSPDDQFILTGSADRTARIWDPNGENVVRTLIGHTDRITSVAWSPDGNFIVTSSTDGTTRVWSSQNGLEIRVISDNLIGINSASWSSDGRFIAVAGLDRRVSLWHADVEFAIDTITHELCELYDHNGVAIEKLIVDWAWQGC